MEFIVKAFLDGMDGVFIGACKLDECNYTTHGNYHALNMVCLMKKILKYIGLNPERLRIEFMSSADGIKFAEVTNEFVNNIKEIGPLAQGEGISQEELKSKLEKVLKLIPYIKLAKKDKLALKLAQPEEYDNYHV